MTLLVPMCAANGFRSKRSNSGASLSHLFVLMLYCESRDARVVDHAPRRTSAQGASFPILEVRQNSGAIPATHRNFNTAAQHGNHVAFAHLLQFNETIDVDQ